jgi:hypothetical protein
MAASGSYLAVSGQPLVAVVMGVVFASCDHQVVGGREPGVLAELGVMEQRYRAVLEVWTKACQ